MGHAHIHRHAVTPHTHIHRHAGTPHTHRHTTLMWYPHVHFSPARRDVCLGCSASLSPFSRGLSGGAPPLAVSPESRLLIIRVSSFPVPLLSVFRPESSQVSPSFSFYHTSSSICRDLPSICRHRLLPRLPPAAQNVSCSSRCRLHFPLRLPIAHDTRVWKQIREMNLFRFCTLGRRRQ